MLLRVETEDREGLALVKAVGEIDVSTAETLAEAVSKSLDAGQPRVLVDFAEVTFIDSTGLGILVRSHRAAEARGATFGIVNPTPQTLKLIRVLGLDQLLSIFDSPEDAAAGPS
jgi:anti-sigma B factor antagonist